MAKQSSKTITVEQVRDQCQTLVLKLTHTKEDAGAHESNQMVNEVKRRVEEHFKDLVHKYVMNEHSEVNSQLMERLKKTNDPETMFEAFLVILYERAVQREDDVVSERLSDKEKQDFQSITSELLGSDQK